MKMRMITDDAMEVHFGLGLLDRAADHAHCHNYPGVNQAAGTAAPAVLVK